MSATGPIRVVIAEDVSTDAELSVRELKRAGLRVVHQVADAEAALRRALAEFQPHVILSDFTMPSFDGDGRSRAKCSQRPRHRRAPAADGLRARRLARALTFTALKGVRLRQVEGAIVRMSVFS